MKKVLFIVPHEDDEIFIGGAMLVNLVRSGNYDVYVFIATNGDYYPFENKIRIKESLNALSVIGIKPDRIIFGGYGDCWRGKHIYNSESMEEKVSEGGFYATYVENDLYKEWHYMRFGEHQNYTRQGYLEDIMDLIESLRPEVIICVDMDAHRDHRCLSLLTEEAIGLILKSDILYCPVVLKKYAYQGVLFGKNDFFIVPHRPTVNDGNITSNPYLRWDQRIRYKVPDDCNTFLLKNNFMYKLICMYKSQDMWTRSDRFINSDIVFWQRNTRNAALHAEIMASSGDVVWLNDFKLLDTEDVMQPACGYARKCWRPEKNDNERVIKIKFRKIQTVDRINFYFNNLAESEIENARIIFYDICQNVIDEINFSVYKKGMFVESIGCNNICDVKSIEIFFEKIKGQIGLGEIEVLNEQEDIPFQEFLFDEDKKEKTGFLLNIIQRIDEMFFKIKKYKYNHFKDGYRERRQKYDRSLRR